MRTQAIKIQIKEEPGRETPKCMEHNLVDI